MRVKESAAAATLAPLDSAGGAFFKLAEKLAQPKNGVGRNVRRQ